MRRETLAALEELKEIDLHALEDGLPAVHAKTKREAERILRELDGRTTLPRITYPEVDGGIVLHFQTPGVPDLVLIELDNDGRADCYAVVDGKSKMAEYGDSSELPDAFVLEQLAALAGGA